MAIEGHVDIATFNEDGEVIEESEQCLRIYFSSWNDPAGLMSLQLIVNRDTSEQTETKIVRFEAGEMEKAAHIAKIAENRER